MLARTFGALLVAVAATSAAVAQDDLAAEAQAALTVWFDASAAGDLSALNAILAPEFQILRSNGLGFGKEEYIQRQPAEPDRIRD